MNVHLAHRFSGLLPRFAALTSLVSGLALGMAGHARADWLHHCDKPAPLSVQQQDAMLRFAGIVRSELEATGQPAALVARSGLDLGRFGQRYSHAGVGLRDSPNSPWSVRQLYFACDEGRPRLFDQGLSGFVLGADDPASAYLSVVLLPAEAAQPLASLALDRARALALLHDRYSANAFAFGTVYQNCNQWLAELMATAWGGLAAGDGPRQRAQQWLQQQAYRPTRFEVRNPLLHIAGVAVPWLHRDDHPADDLAQGVFQVSMPESIEQFVQRSVPGAQRIEFCLAPGRVVVHRGWSALADGCQPGPGDTVVALD